MEREARRAIQSVNNDIRQTTATAAAASAANKRLGDSGIAAYTKWGNQVQWVGRQLMYNFSLPLAAAGVMATKFAMDNERAMTRVTKVYGDTSEAFQRLSQTEIPALEKAFEALSNRYGVQRSEVLQIAGDWAAAGSTGIALARSVETTLKTMVLGEMEATEATEALIAIQAQYGLSSQGLIDTINTLNMVENETGTTMGDLIQTMSRASGTARSAGIDVRHLAALTAALVPASGTAANAGNGLRTMISRLLSPTKEAAEVLDLMGISTKDVGWQSQNGAQRLETLAKAFDGLNDSQKAAVSSTVASRWQINRFDVLMRDIINPMGYYNKSLEATADSDKMLQQAQMELNKVLESSPQRLQQIWTILQNGAANAIQPLIPWILRIGTALAEMATAFSNLPGGVQNMIVAFAAFLVLLGPIARYVGSISVLFGVLRAAVMRVGGGMLSFAGTLTSIIAGPFKLFWNAVTGIAGVGRFILPAWSATMTTLAAVTGAGLKVVGSLFRIGFSSYPGSILASVQPAIAAMWSFMGRIGAVVTAGTMAIRTLWTKGLFLAGAIDVAFIEVMKRLNYFLFTIIPGLVFKGGVVIQVAMMRAFNFSGILPAISAAWATLVGFMARGMTMVSGAIAAGAAGVRTAMGIVGLAMAQGVYYARLAVTGMALWFSRLPALILVGLKAIPALLARFWPAILAVMRTGGAALLRVVTGPWGLAITAVVSAIALFGDKIAAMWNGVIDAFKRNGSGIAQAFKPVVDFFGAAVRAIQNAFNALPDAVARPIMSVVNFVKDAALKVYEWFGYLNPFQRHSPSLVESVTAGMAIVRNQYKSVGNAGAVFAKAANDLKAYKTIASSFSFDEWAGERADVAKVMPSGLGAFDMLKSNLEPLNRLLAEQSVLVDRQSIAVARWQDRLDEANNALDAQEKMLDQARSALDALQSAYDAHEQSLRDYADAGITGQRAMSDAIFENEMAQKRLRLEMMKIEDAGGGIDDIKDKMASLQGDIEKLRGDANDLRAKGAGSDVTGPIDAQIAAMEAAYRAMGDQANNSPINEMQKQLEELQRQGERLDLENSIQFDPLERAIDQLANGMKELPFDQIIAGITNERNAMNGLTPQIDAATKAVAGQQAAVDQLKAARDAVQAGYDAESNKLKSLQSDYDNTKSAINEIEEALRQVTAAAQEASAAMDRAKGSSDGALSPGAQNFLDATGADFADVGGMNTIGREGGMEDQSGLIDQFTQDLANQTADMLGDFDPFGGIKDKWNEFTAWWSANAVPAWNGLVDGVKQIFGTIGEGINVGAIGDKLSGAWSGVQDFWDKLKEFGSSLWDLFGPQLGEIWDNLTEALGPAVDKIKDAWDNNIQPIMQGIGDIVSWLWNNILKPFIAFIGGTLIAALSTIFSVLGNVIGPIVTWIGDLISSIIQVIRGIVDFVAGVFTGDWQRAWDGVTAIFGGIWSAIWSTIENAAKVIWGLVSGLVEGVVDFFTWLWDVLVGHSIIPDMVNAIVDWFQNMWNWVVDKVKGLINAVIGFFTGLWNGAVNIFTNMVNAVVGWFQNMWTWVIAKVTGLRDAALSVWNYIKDKISEIAGNLISPVVDKFNQIKDKVMEKVNWLKDRATEGFNIMRDNILGAWNYVKDKISGIMTGITDFIKSGINGGIRAVNKLIDGLNKVADILPGLDWHISSVPLLAQGGQVPGKQVGPGFKTSGARAIVGEGNPAHPEYVIPTDPVYRNRARELYSELAKDLGIHSDDPSLGIGGIGDTVKGWIGKGADLVKDGADWIKNAAQGAVSTIFRPFKNTVDNLIGNITWDTGRRWAQSGVDEVWNWVTGADEAYKKAADETGGNGPWRKPLNGYTLSSGFGMRVNPVTGVFKLHAGTDLAAPTGTPIYAAAQGTAQRFSGSSGLGNYVKIDHGGGLATQYGHMSAFAGKVGSVQPGDLIGLVGSTGNSTGPHLHFEVRRSGAATDPVPWMRGKGVPLANGGIVRARPGGTLATVGEAGRDEAVIPLPNGWDSGLRGVQQSVQLAAMTVDRLIVTGGIEYTTETLQPATHYEHNEYHFYGDLSFPGITSGEDADEWLRNLGDLAGGSNR